MYSFLNNKRSFNESKYETKNSGLKNTVSNNNVYKIFNRNEIKKYDNEINNNTNKNIDIKEHIIQNIVEEKDECLVPFHIFDKIVIQEVKPLMSFIKTLKNFLKNFNKNVDIENIDQNYMFNTDVCYILVAAHSILHIPADIYYYIYNLEQISYYPYFPLLTEKLGSENFDKKMNYMIHRYNSASGIFDFSKDNLNLYPRVIKHKIKYFPPPCGFGNNNYKKIYKYDILFFGARSKRRTNIISKIRNKCNNIKFYIVNNIYDDNLVELINCSRIVLNIHYDNNASLETIRIHECIMNNTHVVSEEPINKNILNDNIYKNIVTFFPHIKSDLSNIDSAISVIKYVLKNIDKYSQKELYKSKKKFIDIYNNYNINTFLYDNIYLNILNSSKTYYDENIEKYNHRNICIKDTKILRKIDFKCHENTLDLEAVLIEFRPLFHLEFLIENALFRLPNWKHSVVCGNNNVNMINRIVEKLNKKRKSNIKIIFLDIHNITPSQYSSLLMTKDFWQNFVANKVLLYQEDTIIFHNKYDDFLYYDYIGAPWPINQDDNYLGVGNGGFSLRSKRKMIEVIEKVPLDNLILGQSTINYMKNSSNEIVPEDVYFSKSLIDFNIGNVSDRNTANAFSQETVKHDNPFGGHNYWLSEPGGVCKPSYFYNYYIKDEYFLKVTHRYGWKHLIQHCIDAEIIQQEKTANSKLLIDCCENFFVWGNECKNKIIQEDWYGIIHYTNELPDMYNFCNLDKVLNNKNFKQSLVTCKGLIVLTKYLQNYLKSYFTHEIPIYFIPHPIADIDKKFNLYKFKNNKNLNVIQLGLQYRKVLDIYKLKTNYPKVWLPGSKDTKKITSIIKIEEDYNKYKVNQLDVSIINLNNKLYDNKILNNIILIPLWNASANNSILECMRMNIPAFVSNIAPVKEYLGEYYPMYYDNITEVERILNNKELLHQLYERTYNYLVKLDKSIIDYNYFISELLTVVNDN